MVGYNQCLRLHVQDMVIEPLPVPVTLNIKSYSPSFLFSLLWDQAESAKTQGSLITSSSSWEGQKHFLTVARQLVLPTGPVLASTISISSTA